MTVQVAGSRQQAARKEGATRFYKNLSYLQLRDALEARLISYTPCYLLRTACYSRGKGVHCG